MTINLTPDPQTAAAETHPGSCHCGAVRFQVQLERPGGGSRCNCSICTKTSMTSAIVKPAAFKLLGGEDSLSWYEWGGKTARRFFCKHCGVQCFARGYLVEVGGDYVSINLNAIDDLDVAELAMVYWDGRHDNWHAGPRPSPWPIATLVAATATTATATT
jgi:hypothetical protein